MSVTPKNPKLSVVLASQNARSSVFDCLQTLKNQSTNEDIEIIVVDNSTDETAKIISRDFPAVHLINAAKDKLIPELWGIGIEESKGEFIALTTTHFIPSENWIAETIRANEANYAGIGGAIENEANAGIVSWAVYFCRYSPYMLPFEAVEVEDFAADNASYKRHDLKLVEDSMSDGFWENFVHQKMRKDGMKLLKTPEIVVFHRDSFTFWGFMNQRLQHGRQFGGTRAAQMPTGKRAVYVLLSPSIPFLYLYRITQRVFTKKRNIGKFVLALPVLSLFLLSWSAGEFSGYLWKPEKL